MFNVSVPKGILVVNRKYNVINSRLVYIVVVFTQDVRFSEVVNKKGGGVINLVLLRGMTPIKIGYISFPYHINVEGSCLQVKSIYHNGRPFTVLKGYILFNEDIQFSTTQVNSNGVKTEK